MGTVHPFAELDALRTERNSAVAESKLWLRRVLKANKERDQAMADLRAADKCLSKWQAAYATLQARAEDLSATIERLSDEVFMLQTRAVVLEAEALLLKYDVAQSLNRVYESEAA